MCPCNWASYYLCGHHRRLIVDDMLRLREAEADGRGYDDEIRALRGRLAGLGWRRALVEGDLDYRGEEYARTARPVSGAVA